MCRSATFSPAYYLCCMALLSWILVNAFSKHHGSVASRRPGVDGGPVDWVRMRCLDLSSRRFVAFLARFRAGAVSPFATSYNATERIDAAIRGYKRGSSPFILSRRMVGASYCHAGWRAECFITHHFSPLLPPRRLYACHSWRGSAWCRYLPPAACVPPSAVILLRHSTAVLAPFIASAIRPGRVDGRFGW